MGPLIDAWFVLVVSMAGWLNREQNKALEYLRAENAVLKERHTSPTMSLPVLSGRSRSSPRTTRRDRLCAGNDW